MGIAASALLILDVATLIAIAIARLCYLSVCSIGGDFLRYQRDALLLESRLVASFVAPLRLRPRLRNDAAPPRLGVWVARLLVVKLMLLSGLVKLTSAHARGSTDLHLPDSPPPCAIALHMTRGLRR